MKKIIALLLTVVLCFSLCACGGGGEKESESPSNVIYLDEPIAIGDYEITITDAEFVDNWNPNGDSEKFCSEGNVHFVAYYTVKNIGKTEVSVPYHMLKLVYNDGYEFKETAETGDTYCYSFDTHSYVYNDTVLPVLSQAKPCQTYLEVPVEVRDNNDAPLKLEITVNEETYVYNVRPIDDKQKEIFYNKGITFMNEKDYKTAIRMFENSGDFSDAKEKYDEAALLYYIEAPYFGSAPDYFNANKDSYELLTGDEIKNFIVGEWHHSDLVNKNIVYNSDGTIDNQYTTGGVWKISENMIEIADSTNMDSDSYEVRKIKEGMYLFYRDGEKPAFSLQSIEK